MEAGQKNILVFNLHCLSLFFNFKSILDQSFPKTNIYLKKKTIVSDLCGIVSDKYYLLYSTIT